MLAQTFGIVWCLSMILVPPPSIPIQTRMPQLSSRDYPPPGRKFKELLMLCVIPIELGRLGKRHRQKGSNLLMPLLTRARVT